VALCRQRSSWRYEQQHLKLSPKAEDKIYQYVNKCISGWKKSFNKVLKITGKSSSFSNNWQMFTGISKSLPPCSVTCTEVQ